MGQSQHQNHQPVIVDFVYDAIVAHADAPKVFVSRQFDDASWPRIVDQRLYFTDDSPLQSIGEFA